MAKVGHANVSFVYNYLLVIFWVVIIGIVLNCITGCTPTLPADSPECAGVDTSLKGTKVTTFTPTTDQTKCGAHTLPVGALLLDIAVDML